MARRTWCVFWEIIGFSLIQQQKERVQPTIKDVIIDAVQTCLFHPSFMQNAHPLACMLFQLLYLTILDRLRWACLGTGRCYAILHAIITERTLVGPVISLIITRNHAKGTGQGTITAPVTNILLHIDRIKLGAYNRACGACLVAGGMGTMFADIAAHQPAIGIEKGQSSSWRCRGDRAITFRLSYAIF